MNPLAEKFASLEARISEEKGPFCLFALVLREDAPDRWDLLISAPWLDYVNLETAVTYMVDEIKSHLGADALIQLSRIIPIDPNQEPVRELNRSIQVEHGIVELKDCVFFGLPIKQAFIITSQTLDAPALR